MKKLTILLFAVSCLSCKSSHSQDKPNPEALKLDIIAVHLGFDSVYKHPDLAYRSHALRNAISILDKATAIDSNYSMAYNNKFGFQLQLNLLDSALITAKHLIRINPKEIGPKLMVGQTYDKMGDTVNALKYYQTAIVATDQKLETTDINGEEYEQIKVNKGLIYIMMDQPAKGRKILKNLYDNTKDAATKELLQQLMTMTKHDLLYGRIQIANPIRP